jgi:WD40 repeat protein
MNNNNNIVGPPRKMNNNHIQNAENQVFGEFNYTNMDNNIEETEPKVTETTETEPYKELTLQEKIYNEYERHKEYLDANEKGVYSEIHKKSYKNAKRYKYRKSLLLHEKEITSICSLSGKIKKITYATSSLDKTIKFWNTKFASVYKIKNLQWHSNFLCEFDTTNLLSSESIYIKIYDLMSDSFECTKIYRDHIEDINAILPLINSENNEYSFMTGGKDKILRLWNIDFDSPIRYYEGHFDTVTHIQKIAGDITKIISCSIDKTFIIWDIRNTNPIKVFNNYFNHLCLLGDSVGFCCGAYDNKIRFYDDAYIISKCLVSEFYGIRLILMIDDYYMLIVDIDNNINVLDTYENNFLFKYAGSGGEIVSVIKSYNWDADNSENKIIITACKDGYVYLYSFELEINNKISKNKKNSKKKDDKKEKDKSRGKDKAKKIKSAKKK